MATTAERVARHRKRAQERGAARIAVTLPPEAAKRLQRLSDALGVSRSRVIVDLVMRAPEKTV